MVRILSVLILAGALFQATPVLADFTLNFEALEDLDFVTNQYASYGVTFANALALEAGISLNEYDFPPHSGSVVISDDAGPMRLDFSVPVTTISGYFTYVSPLTMSAYDSGDGLLASINSTYSENTTTSGNPTNDFLDLTYLGGIHHVIIEGDPFGGSFTLDDLAVSQVPVPPQVWPMLVFSGLYLVHRRARKHTSGE